MTKEIMEQRAAGYQNSAVQFSTIIVANLMLINSGALFAFPAYLQKAVAITPAVVAATSAPSTSFVVGVVLATLCGYVAYLNYGLLRQAAYTDHFIDDINLKYPISSGLSPAIIEWRSKTLTELTKKSERFTNLIWATFWFGQVLGLGSLAAFVIGCYLAKSAIFAQ